MNRYPWPPHHLTRDYAACAGRPRVGAVTISLGALAIPKKGSRSSAPYGPWLEPGGLSAWWLLNSGMYEGTVEKTSEKIMLVTVVALGVRVLFGRVTKSDPTRGDYSHGPG